MRFKWWWGVGLLLLVAVVTAGTISLVRWRAAGTAHPIQPPAGASAWDPTGRPYERTVIDRASIIAHWLRTDRGPATVRIYVLPAKSPWLRARMTVATQLDHWEQDDSCADNPAALIVECAWREPTRWWPRSVQLTMLRPPPAGDGWPDATWVIIGTGPGE